MRPSLHLLAASMKKLPRCAGNALSISARRAAALLLRGLRRPGRDLLRAAGRFPRPRSLKVRLALGASVVAAAILLVTYATLTSSARKVAAEQVERHVDEVLSYFSGIFAEAVAAGDRMQVHLLARALLDNGVQALSVVDRNGEVLYSSGFSGEQSASPGDLKAFAHGLLGTTTFQGKVYLHAASPIRFGDAPVGIIDLRLNRTDLEERMREAHGFVYPIFAAGFLLFLGLGGVAWGATFRALKGLTEAAERIGAGDLSSRVPVSGKDEVAAFCGAFNRMADSLSRAREEIAARHLETIRAVISAVEAKDSYTQGHCVRVQRYVRRILERFPECARGDQGSVETAALLHDIGKIGIPDQILLKENRLSKKESEKAREHAILGERILSHVDSMKDVSRWIRHHHERWDGFGYPDGLRGDAIPFASRLIGVADCIDAMLTDRPYRKALTIESVVKVLEKERGTQFDPGIVDRAIELLREEAMVPETDAEEVERNA